MNKIAALKARNYSELAEAISKVNKNIDSKKMADDLLFANAGSGSIFASAGKSVLNAVTPKSKKGDVVAEKFKGLQRNLSDADMRAGSAMKEVLDKKTKLGKFFEHKYNVKTDTPINGADTEAIIEATRLTAPIDKTKKVTLPTIGAFWVASKMAPAENQGEKLSREELIDTITKLAGFAEPSEKKSIDKKTELVKKASEALMKAAAESRIKDEIIEKMAEEIESLKSSMNSEKKTKRCEEIVEDMINKGLISVNKKQDQLDKLVSMQDNEVDVFEEAIKAVPKPTETSHLTALSEDTNIVTKKDSMKHAFETGSILEK